MAKKQKKPPSKKQFVTELSIWFVCALVFTILYFLLDESSFPAKQDLVAIKSKVEHYKEYSSSKRISMHVDFENGMKVIYHFRKPKYHLIKNLLSKGEEVVFYVDKTGKYKTGSGQLHLLMVESRGEIIVS